AEASPDWLIIDLLEERFDLLRTDGSLITRSSDFMNSRLPDAPRFDFELIKRYWPETRQLYADGVPGFAERLQETVSAQRVILHHVRWATTYWSGADLRAFPADRVAWGEIQNELLADAYGRLAAALPGCQHISMPDELFVGDATGRWALEPFHYSEAYNAAARSRLVEIVDG
ncbi:MAG: hypothetical protein QOJ29_1104, partial [Thermoleophilaceae bacterium]|nr:hypothetical protein [Thermoleophilaceae bacterium]